MPEHLWRALEATSVEGRASAAQPGSHGGSIVNLTDDWYHVSYVWSVVSMAAFAVARASAQQARETLYYIPAKDWVERAAVVQSGAESRQELERDLLGVPSLSKTGRLPGFALLHQGMRVRLTTTLDPPWAVQDVGATVVGIEYDPREAQSRGAQPGEVLLAFMPPGCLRPSGRLLHPLFGRGLSARCPAGGAAQPVRGNPARRPFGRY